MMLWKNTLIAAATLFSVTAGLLFSSCSTKSGCDTLQCQNGGTCASDFCNCPAGYDGPQCENKITNRYIGTYAGYTQPTGGQPAHVDTVDVYVSQEPLTLSVVRRRFPDMIFTGTLQSKNNTVVIPDMVSGDITRVINFTMKLPTQLLDSMNTCNLSVLEYTNGKKTADIQFDGVQITKKTGVK